MAARSEEENPGNDDLGDVRKMADTEFLSSIEGTLSELETARLIALKSYNLRMGVSFLAIILAAVVCYYKNDFVYLLIVLTIGFCIWTISPKYRYTKKYKRAILPKIASLFQNLKYEVGGQINLESNMHSGIIPGYNRYLSDDYFRGRYKNVAIEFSEIMLLRRKIVHTRSGSKEREIIVFKGLAVSLSVQNKKFLGHTVIDYNRTVVGQWLQDKTTPLKRVRMADPEFEKIFDVYTNDQVEARYLVDAIVIEGLKDLSAQFPGEKINAAFFDNKMLIMVASRKNRFEPASIRIKATRSEGILQVKNEIGIILSIIDKLSLYNPQHAA